MASEFYRCWTDFQVGRTLVPLRAEFLSIFSERRWNSDRGQFEDIPLIPGTRAYMEAEKRADARQRHYLRVALVLQGLIDRTTVFHPLPGPVQFTQPESYDRGWVTIVNDGEFILGDGRERFRDWQARLAALLVPGMRIIGAFLSWSGDEHSFRSMRDKDGQHPRLAPSKAEDPPSNVLYRLEGRRDGGLVFFYDREVWDRYDGYRAAKTRSSCVIQTTDRFILPFDLITAAELRYYLQSRQDRPDYITMIPLLKVALQLKEQETAEEAPFRTLLITHIARHYDIDPAEVEGEIDDLMRWFKFKNQYHRALVGDHESLAFQAILCRFGSVLEERANRARREAAGEYRQVVARVRRLYPEVVLIAHKTDNHYVALVAATSEPVFVHEVTLTLRGEPRVAVWRTVDQRTRQWHILWQSERWSQWMLHPNRADYLPDPEIAQLGAMLQELSQTASRGRQLLAITFDRDDRAFHMYWQRADAQVPREHLLSAPIEDVRVEQDRYTWQYNLQREARPLSGGGRSSVTWPDAGCPWDAGMYRRSGPYSSSLRRRAEDILILDTDRVVAVQASHAAYRAADCCRSNVTGAGRCGSPAPGAAMDCTRRGTALSYLFARNW